MYCRNGFSAFQDVNSWILNMDPYIVPEEVPIIILYRKSSVCMAKNGKDTKYTRHFARRVNIVRNGEKFNLH